MYFLIILTYDMPLYDIKAEKINQPFKLIFQYNIISYFLRPHMPKKRVLTPLLALDQLSSNQMTWVGIPAISKVNI